MLLASAVVPTEAGRAESRHFVDKRVEERVDDRLDAEPEREQQRVDPPRLVRQLVDGAEDGPHRVIGGCEAGRAAKEQCQRDVLSVRHEVGKLQP